MPLRPPTHGAPRRQREFKARRAAADVERGTAAQRGYGSRWQRTRIGFLAAHPLCASCMAAGRVTEATVVDHIVPHRGDMNLFWQRSNWQPLCKPCHDRKTATEDSTFAVRRRDEGTGGR